MEEQWINDLRKKMASHQTPVPPGLWENIESNLRSAQPAPMPFAKKFLLWTSGIGSVAAAVAFAFLFLGREDSVAVPPSATVYALKQEGAMVPPRLLENNTEIARNQGNTLALRAATSPLDYLPQQTAASQRVEIQQHSVNDKVLALAENTPTDKNTVTAETNSTSNRRKPTPQPQQNAEQKQTAANQKEKASIDMRSGVSSRQRANLLATAAAPRQQRWAVNLYAANLTHTSHHTEGYGEFVAGTALPKDFSNSQFPVKDLIYSNLGREIETKKKHRLPLRFGISARYQLTPRFSLESGLNYTYLGSELTSGTADHHFMTEQRLQYLGIPIMLGFDLWKNKRWNFYLSAGGMLEKCIHGKSSTDYIINNQLVYTHENSVMEKPWQGSVIGNFGAQLNLSSHFGIYAEPGICYYFDNGSPIETIYKDQPLNFNFKLGLRIQLN